MAGIVLRTANRLSAALNTAAQSTAMGEHPDLVRLEEIVKGLPVAEFPASSIILDRPRILPISVSLARRSLRRQLDSQAEHVLMRFFNGQGRALELWFRAALRDLQREFDANGEIYRAQFQRLLHHDRRPEAAGQTLSNDIALLERALRRDEAIYIRATA